MEFTLKNGRGTETFSLEDSKILQVLTPPGSGLKPCGPGDVEHALDNPLGTAPLSELLARKKPSNVGLPEQVIMNVLNQNTGTFCGRKIFWK